MSLPAGTGFDEILRLLGKTERDPVLSNKGQFQLLALHSSISAKEQRRVFVKPPAVRDHAVHCHTVHLASLTSMFFFFCFFFFFFLRSRGAGKSSSPRTLPKRVLP